MQIKISELLKKYNLLANNLSAEIHRLRGTYNLAAGLFSQAMLFPLQHQSLVNQLIEKPEFFLKNKEQQPDNLRQLQENLRLLSQLNQSISEYIADEEINASWITKSIEIDDDLLAKIEQNIKDNRGQVDKELLKALTYSFDALYELVQNEHTFVTTCETLTEKEIGDLQETIVTYRCFKKPPLTPAQTKELTESLAVLTEYQEIRNHLNFNLKTMLVCATDVGFFSETLFFIFGSPEFSEFQQKNLLKLAKAYYNISQQLQPLITDLKAGDYAPERKPDAEQLNAILDILATPFQRIARYKLTFDGAYKYLDKLSQLNYKPFVDRTLEINGEVKFRLKDAIDALKKRLKGRADLANEAIAQKENPQLFKLKLLDNPQINQLPESHPLSLSQQSPEEILTWIKQQIETNPWKTGRFATAGTPYHIRLMLALMERDENKSEQELLEEIIDIAKTAKDYKPPIFNFLYKRDLKTQQFYETVASLVVPEREPIIGSSQQPG